MHARLVLAALISCYLTLALSDDHVGGIFVFIQRNFRWR